VKNRFQILLSKWVNLYRYTAALDPRREAPSAASGKQEAAENILSRAVH
jgi:hypothetical protein